LKFKKATKRITFVNVLSQSQRETMCCSFAA